MWKTWRGMLKNERGETYTVSENLVTALVPLRAEDFFGIFSKEITMNAKTSQSSSNRFELETGVAKCSVFLLRLSAYGAFLCPICQGNEFLIYIGVIMSGAPKPRGGLSISRSHGILLAFVYIIHILLSRTFAEELGRVSHT